MPAVALLEKNRADASLNEVFDAAQEHFGQVPNLVKALANNPALCRSITNFLIQAIGQGRIDWATKELVILKTLRAVGSHYSYGAHERIALELGVPVEKLGEVANSLWRTSPRFSERERVLFELAEQVAHDANAVSDDLWKRLRAHWNSGQLLEINAVITTLIMVGKVGDTLGVADPVLFAKPAKAR